MISRCCARCAPCYPSRSSPRSCFSTRLQGTVSLHSFYPLLWRWITATIIPHALKWHRNTKQTDLNIDSPSTPLSSAQTFLPFTPPPLFPWKRAAIPNPIVTSVLAGQGRKREEKQWKWWFLLKSEPVVCNLLRHSTSSVSLFNHFMHREDIKKAGRLVRIWWQVPIQTLNINGGGSEALVRTRSLSSALKKHLGINCHPIFIFCQSVCATLLIPHSKCLWHIAHSNDKYGNVKICRYARGDLVCKDHKGSGRVNGNAQRERHDSSDDCRHWMSHFNPRIVFDCVSGVLRDSK